MDEKKKGGAWQALLLPIVIVVAVIAVIVYLTKDDDACVTKGDFSLSTGEISVEFCTPEQKLALAIIEQAQATYESEMASATTPEEKDRVRSSYEGKMNAALDLVQGRSSGMGPLEDSVRDVLEPFLP